MSFIFTPKSRSQRGFSLVEMLITIAVIAIIAGISVPMMSKVFTNSQDSAARRNAQTIAGVASSAVAAGSTAINDAADKNAAVELLTTGINGAGQFAENVFVINLDEDSRDQTLKYLEFKDGQLAFDPAKE